ncbi:MAG: redox-regulated ATPase YchF [Pseudodesulfovibrio sp.]|uniref:Ribosome-binding ATPase YchF n=1 Tax=Pseudodesulfovibrio aespoeensis (strain ATCC 700646 / DSM 10631 / Aspo-2) TaxID=643562 RepID=E6VYT8_PSEA9|nr:MULTISPECIES: redox-regulated ATPase YchF [Pseudodesulfovibrio]MBU4192699.1 redox-regulated ATPase YchF [Pseudomonadota bacterium]ADU63955.1 GTP-binding protein YchF [Pseudodesulfovibrio aespoeensis Aspo-2]MBU4244172.1 redox-regulated ATPase YchF [Pseudomonadota bacterium]MBU4379273.1 redox-regulated ATPase YchF [Pseudomonadota bacterium]MBU4474376.1 redox-regulated ATPase YchF [Pseudomonadota bacterium]
MSLSIGIVGLPNVGKSTLFNALTKAQNAECANYAFCTIEPNKAVVPVPDPRLQVLADLVRPQRVQHSTVDFVDIAGLVAGASKGEGLGNKFLANIRETQAILHVVRCFDDDDVIHVSNSVDPLRDIEIIETELLLADVQALDTRIERMGKQLKGDKGLGPKIEVAKRLLAHMNQGGPASSFAEESKVLAELLAEMRLITSKKVIYCANVDEEGVAEDNDHVRLVRGLAMERGAEFVNISAKMEEDLVGLEEDEYQEFMESYGISESGLDQIIRTGFRSLGLISYFTAGVKEVRAWTINDGDKAPRAAAAIHTDFERGFIRAEVIGYDQFVAHGSEARCRAAGALRVEGKEYVVRDGDVVHFLFNV